ncbi:hypothetical protein N8334_04225 [Flavobacteriaceae bacterium]|nr:hypothetical protein [Flavobacteriaceae bacterium]
MKDHPVGDLPAGPPAVSLLKHPFFGICTGSSELREKYFQKKEEKGGYSIETRK